LYQKSKIIRTNETLIEIQVLGQPAAHVSCDAWVIRNKSQKG